MAIGQAGGIGGGIGGAIGGIAALAMDKGIPREYQQIINLWQKLQSPTFDMRELAPAELQVVAEVSPQTYDAHIAAPVSLASDGREGRQAQLDTMDYLGNVQREGLPLAERLAAKQQMGALATERARGDEAIIDNLKSRGRLGGGSEIAARSALGQHATNLASAQGDSLAMQAIKNRMDAAMSRGSLGSNLRAGDQSHSAGNADRMNNFNRWVSQLKTGASRDASQDRGRADAANSANRQRIADTNVMNRYNNSSDNLDRGNELRNQSYQNELARIGGLSGALGGMAGAKDAENAARMRNVRGIGQGIGQAAGGAFGLG